MYETMDIKLWNRVCDRCLYHAQSLLEPGFKVSAEEAHAAAELIHAAAEIAHLGLSTKSNGSINDSAWFR